MGKIEGEKEAAQVQVTYQIVHTEITFLL